MHACMDGWMDGCTYVCMYTVIGPSLVHKCDGLALDTFVQRFVAMILRFLSEMFINHHGDFWGDGMDNYFYIYICVCVLLISPTMVVLLNHIINQSCWDISQLGWWHSQHMESHNPVMFQTTTSNQIIVIMTNHVNHFSMGFNPIQQVTHRSPAAHRSSSHRKSRRLTEPSG